MNHKTISVESKPRREGQKSRSFSVELLAYVLANDLWELGGGAKERSHRPVLMAYAATDQASRAFSANLRCGRPAALAANSSLTTRFEIPRSAGFRYETVSRDEATLTLAYLPSVFGFKPASSEAEDLSFLCLPPTWWIDEQVQVIAPTMGKDAREAAIAAYFVAFLDQRSPLPIANDLGFHLKLFRAALNESWCQTSSGSELSPGRFFQLGLETLGFETALHCKVDHPTFAQFLKAQTATHLPSEQETTDHGTPGIHRPRRVFPDPVHASAQLGLFG